MQFYKYEVSMQHTYFKMHLNILYLVNRSNRCSLIDLTHTDFLKQFHFNNESVVIQLLKF